ncbi:LysE family translocator [archaeon]|nr:LysE family translocator [archaeon]
MENFLIFLFSVAVISLSGVLSPGPVLGVTIAKGYSEKNAGVWISLGHGLLEFPLMMLLFFGLAPIFTNPTFRMAIGLVGGVLLIYLGYGMLRAMGKASENSMDLPYSSFTAGAITTGAAPYFWLWWATIGLNLITRAAAYGLAGFVIFMIVHWLCDLASYTVISRTINKSKNIWSENVHKAVFGGFGLMLAVFGAWFIATAF